MHMPLDTRAGKDREKQTPRQPSVKNARWASVLLGGVLEVPLRSHQARLRPRAIRMIDSLSNAPFQSQKQERPPGPKTQEGEHANTGNHTHADYTPAKIASSIQVALASSNNYFAKCQLESRWREPASQL
jgi:hypothetical protein